MRISWLITGLCALTLTACDDDAPGTDPPEADLGAIDLGATDGATELGVEDADPTDLGVDAAPDVGVDMTPPEPCPALVPIESPPRGVLADAVLREAVALGGPAPTSTLRARDLDGDGVIDVAVARGGRVEMIGVDGAVRWSSPVFDAVRLAGITDLDGDGRLEVVAISPRTVAVFDGLTGAEVFRMPEAPIAGAPAFAGVQSVALVDVDLDGRTDLYVTDRGCTLEGTGAGVVFRFPVAVENPPLATPIQGPRINGRCARWHTLNDLDGDALPDLLVNDARGLNLFDPLTGARRWCGVIPGVESGAVPHTALDALPDRPGLEVLAYAPDAVHLLAPSDEPRPDCGDAPTLRPAWSVPGAGFAPDAGGLIELDAPAVALTQFTEGAWQIRFVSPLDGTPHPVQTTLPETRLLAMADLDGDDTPELVIARPSPESGDYDRLDVLRWAGAAFESVLDAPVARAQLLTLDPARADATATTERTRPVLVRAAGETRVAALRDADDDGTPDALWLLGVSSVETPLAGSPGAAWVTCDPSRCDTADALVLSLAGGEIAAFDASLALVNATAAGTPALVAPTGRVALTVADDGGRQRLVARTANGVVGVVDPERPEAPLRWSTPVGGGFRTFQAPFVASVDDTDLLVMPAARFGPTAWIGLDAADGALLWVHSLDPTGYLTRGRGELVPTAEGPRLIRIDLVRDGEAVRPELDCPVTYAGDPAEREPRCPDSPILPRSLIAVDPADGQCVWQTVLRPNDNCTGPANQQLSVTDTDGDGWPELWATETNALRRIDPLTGLVTTTIDLGYVAEGGAGRGGGWVLAGADEAPVIRAGGNGPIDAFIESELVWRAEAPEGLRPQSWTARAAVVVGDEVWVSPGTGRPLDRYGSADGAVRGRVGLQAGVALPDPAAEAGLADVSQIAWRENLAADGGPAVLITTDEPFLYAMDADGALAWSRELPALPDLPLVGDVDLDGLDEVVVPLADGRILVGDEPGPAPPTTVYDRPCPAGPLCGNDDTADLDQSGLTDQLCAAWVPVADAAGYEVRAVTETGAALTPWRDTAEPFAGFGELGLVPGARYAVEIRTWRASAMGGRERSASATSDGVRITDGSAPTIQLTVSPPQTPAGVGATFGVDAQDDDRIAGRRLEIQDAQGGLVWVAPIDQGVRAAWVAQIEWPGVDQAGRVAPPGAYRVLGRVEDRAGNATAAEAALTVCDGPCL